MFKKPIGVQVHSVREDFAADPEGTFKTVSGMGYRGVEFVGEPKFPAVRMKEALYSAGLVCCGWHAMLPMLTPENMQAIVDYNKELGNNYIIIAAASPEMLADMENLEKLIKELNRINSELKKQGIHTGYHCHDTDFGIIEGKTTWDHIFDNTPQDFLLQLDTGNALAGGAESVPILKKYPGRSVTVHLKPYSLKDQGYDSMIGQDDIPWEEVYETCESIGGTKWYIIEYNRRGTYTPFEGVKKCLDAFVEIRDKL